MDVGLEETCQLALCALVGRFTYKCKCDLSFLDWMKEVWLSRLGYIPTFTTLTCGWFSLLFKTPEDAESILSQLWDYKGGSLMLKWWRTSFNLSSEYFSYRHVWVLLPGLPLNLWNLPVLTAIGNLLGHFLKKGGLLCRALIHSIYHHLLLWKKGLLEA
jgi:hypothetical protein